MHKELKKIVKTRKEDAVDYFLGLTKKEQIGMVDNHRKETDCEMKYIHCIKIYSINLFVYSSIKFVSIIVFILVFYKNNF